MNELYEVPMSGTPDNDYAFGDYVCRCYRCGVDYHGPDGIIICHECLLKIDKPPNNCALWAMFYLSGLGLVAWSIYQLV
jgi:hypothetical protein